MSVIHIPTAIDFQIQAMIESLFAAEWRDLGSFELAVDAQWRSNDASRIARKMMGIEE